LIICRRCGYSGEEIHGHDGKMRCPWCGNYRDFVLAVQEEIKAHEKAVLRAYRSGLKRPCRELVQGDELFKARGQWVKKYRLIDREQNVYHERVVDPATGEVIHECKERLTDHRGHGSARHGKVRDGERQ